jgi:hypothetical protein
MIHHARKSRDRRKSPQPRKPTDLAFLSARHTHFAAAFCIFLASWIALITLSAVFVTITTTKIRVLLLPLVCRLIVWFCGFRPKVVAVAPSKEMLVLRIDRFPYYLGGSPKRRKTSEKPRRSQ